MRGQPVGCHPGYRQDTAPSRVTTAERSPQFLTFLAKQSFWSDFLKRHHPRQFSTLDTVFPPRLEALFEQADTPTTADYLKQVEDIPRERDTVESAVMKRLTDDIIRQTDQGLCILPEF